MFKRWLTIPPLLCALFFVTIPEATAQNLRPENTFFIKPQVGLANYLGDNEKSPTNFNFDLFKIDGKLPYNVGLELGYQFSVPFSVNAGYQLGNNPIITQFGNEVGDERGIDNDPTIRHSVALFGRYTFAHARSRVAPYLNFGAAYAFGNVRQPDGSTQHANAAGPLLGLGLDVALNNRTSLFVESISTLSMNDTALDANDANGFGSSDILTGIGLGLKVNFKRAFTPVQVYNVDCPSELVVGAPGTFTASVNDDVASQPVEYRWDFGDASTGTGLSSTHSYTEGGSHTVTFTATNSGSTDAQSCTVQVVSPAEIVTLTADKTTVSTCAPDPSITFSANVQGDTPMEYQWDFGDGTTSDQADPSHSYEATGTYTVTLTVTNRAGTDTRTMTVTVNDEGCFNCDVLQMNSVYFDRNSSVLTEQAQASLQENIEIFRNCPNTDGRLEGYASRDERNPQALSEDRARAVEQYYIQHEVAASRLTPIGMGAAGQTAKKGGDDQFRRVDTIPSFSTDPDANTED